MGIGLHDVALECPGTLLVSIGVYCDQRICKITYPLATVLARNRDVSLWGSAEGIEDIKEISDNMIYVWRARWRDLTPGAGSCSESDCIEPDFHYSFWGDRYERLYEIKQKCDPYGILFAQNAVGSEDWVIDSYFFWQVTIAGYEIVSGVRLREFDWVES